MPCCSRPAQLQHDARRSAPPAIHLFFHGTLLILHVHLASACCCHTSCMERDMFNNTASTFMGTNHRLLLCSVVRSLPSCSMMQESHSLSPSVPLLCHLFLQSSCSLPLMLHAAICVFQFHIASIIFSACRRSQHAV